MPRRPLATTSVRDALDSAVIALGAAGCDTPRLDAELLLADVLGVDRARLFLEPDRGLSPAEAHAFMASARRRREREPVAYIIGRKGFRRLELAVDRRVLVPRPETETLVEVALAELPRAARVADVGTGSGAVAVALATERPDLVVVATDVSAAALDVARANAAAHGARVDFRHADLLTGVDGPLDGVVANLPYVPQGTPLEPEIVRYEPPGAVFAGPDGLGAYRRLLGQAGDVPWIALECGSDQTGALADLVRAAGFARVREEPDLAGAPRIVVGVRS